MQEELKVAWTCAQSFLGGYPPEECDYIGETLEGSRLYRFYRSRESGTYYYESIAVS